MTTPGYRLYLHRRVNYGGFSCDLSPGTYELRSTCNGLRLASGIYLVDVAFAHSGVSSSYIMNWRCVWKFRISHLVTTAGTIHNDFSRPGYRCYCLRGLNRSRQSPKYSAVDFAGAERSKPPQLTGYELRVSGIVNCSPRYVAWGTSRKDS